MSHRPDGERLRLIEARNSIFPLSVPDEDLIERLVLPQGAVVPPPRLRAQIGFQAAQNNNAETGKVGVVIGDYTYDRNTQRFEPNQNRLYLSLAELVALNDNLPIIIQRAAEAEDMRAAEEDARQGRHAVDEVDRVQAARAHVEDRGLVVPARTIRNGPPARAAAPAARPIPTQARPAVRARVGDDAAELATLRTRQNLAVAANTRRNANEDANAAPASEDEDNDDQNNHNNNNASVHGNAAAAAPRRIASNSTVRAAAAAAAAEHRATAARNRGTVRAGTQNRGSANAAAQAAYQQGGTVAGPSGSRRNPIRATTARSQTQHTSDTNVIFDLTNDG